MNNDVEIVVLVQLSEFTKLMEKTAHASNDSALKEGKGNTEETIEPSNQCLSDSCEKAPDPRGVLDEPLDDSNVLPKQVLSEEPNNSVNVQSATNSLDVNNLIDVKVWSRYQSKAKKLMSALSRKQNVSFDSAGVLYVDGSPKAGLNLLGKNITT